MVDPARVRRLLEALTSYRDQLEKLRDLPSEDYLTQALAGRYLVQVSAQTCIDHRCRHLQWPRGRRLKWLHLASVVVGLDVA